jgi:hypothetical protein
MDKQKFHAKLALKQFKSLGELLEEFYLKIFYNI